MQTGGESIEQAVSTTPGPLVPPIAGATSVPGRPRRRFEELDVLRGVAALAVVVFHYSGHATRYFTGFPFHFKLGEHGVQLFFGISGFVIFMTLENTKKLRDFVVSRFSRLYPAYWITLVILAVATLLAHEKVWLTGLAVNVTMLQSFVGVGDFDLVFWTLAVELVFYVIMGTLFALGLTRRIVPIALAWLALGAAVGLAGPQVPAWISVYTTRFLILPHAPLFIIGMMWFRIHTDGVSRVPVLVVVAAVATVFVASGIAAGLIAAGVCVIVGLAVLGALSLAVGRVTLWLGAISYPLYLLHRNLGYTLLFALDRLGVPSVFNVLVAIAFALSLATAVSVFVERPAMAAIRKRYKNWSARAHPETVEVQAVAG
ncbi:MAG TPA: acyltransferase [Gemmatimonadaceae bacterium]|nr:acyltransferase [Gemmatimonadaceae bacterium]